MGTVQTLRHRLWLELRGQWLSCTVQNRAGNVIKRSCAHLLSSFLRGHMIAQPIVIIQILWLIVWFFHETSPKWMILLLWLHRFGVLGDLERVLILIVILLEELRAVWPAIHLHIITTCAIVVFVALLLPQWKHLIIIFWVALLVLWHLIFDRKIKQVRTWWISLFYLICGDILTESRLFVLICCYLCCMFVLFLILYKSSQLKYVC